MGRIGLAKVAVTREKIVAFFVYWAGVSEEVKEKPCGQDRTLR